VIIASRYSTSKHRCLVDKLQDRVPVVCGSNNAIDEASQLTIPFIYTCECIASVTLHSSIHYYELLYLFVDEECQEMDENAKRNKNVRERGVSCFNEALPILQYICSKLDEAQK